MGLDAVFHSMEILHGINTHHTETGQTQLEQENVWSLSFGGGQ